jgi:glycerol dehydrogenase
MYTTDGKFSEYRFYSRSPDAVIVDTKIIAEAPARYLACGIGDALSKKFEVEACYTSGHNNQIMKPCKGCSPLVGIYLADLLYEFLNRWGTEAMASAKHKVVTPALEAIVEGSILISGLAFESGGLAAAHSVYDGLTCLESKMRPHQYHGELVHFGTCVQLILEERQSDLIHEVFTFGHQIGLPETFEEIGLKEITDEEIWKVAEKTTDKTETIHKMVIEVTPQRVFDAMKTVDEIGRVLSGQIPRVSYEC